MRLLIYWVISAIALIVSAYIAAAVGFRITLDFNPWWKIMLGTLVLGLVNATIGRFLKIIVTPLACLTLGLAWLLVNALLFYIVGQIGDPTDSPMGFYVGDFWAAIAGSLLMGLVLGALRKLTEDDDRPS